MYAASERKIMAYLLWRKSHRLMERHNEKTKYLNEKTKYYILKLSIALNPFIDTANSQSKSQWIRLTDLKIPSWNKCRNTNEKLKLSQNEWKLIWPILSLNYYT